MDVKKDLKQLAAHVTSLGWTVEHTKGNHLRWITPDGLVAAHSPATPSDKRALLNLRSNLRHAGLPR